MKFGSRQNWLCVLLTLLAAFTCAAAETRRTNRVASAIPNEILLRVIRHEDERRWDDQLRALLSDKEPRVRKRAALAAGRIGDARAVPALIDLLKKDADFGVQQMAAFALGEIESVQAANALIEATRTLEVRARALEALGKIAAALPQTDEAPRQAIGQVILNALTAERADAVRTAGGVRDLGVELLGLTAAMRARPTGADKVVALYLSSVDPRVRADAANALARLRAKEGLDQLRRLLVEDQSPISRANAVRALGAAEDKQAFDALLDRALHDNDLRVRVSAIRALGSLKDERAAQPLIERGDSLLRLLKLSGQMFIDTRSELIEIAAAVGRIISPADREKIVDFLRSCRRATDTTAPEIEVAIARQVPHQYWADGVFQIFIKPVYLKTSGQHRRPVSTVPWRTVSALCQGLREAAVQLSNPASLGSNAKPDVETARKETLMRMMGLLSGRDLPTEALPDFLRAYSVLKPEDLTAVLKQHLLNPDVITRATSAELLGEQSPSDTNARALIEALPRSLHDKDLNDAALAILDALAKQKSKEANDAIKTALDSSDHLIRRKAVALLKMNGAGDFSNRIGTVKTRNTEADYRRAIARIGKHVTATVVTSKGSFTIEFLPEDAPLTVDNFIQLARKGFFNGQTIPRVVPNFVIQAGDPRGDTNGGPGYQIRCEINEVPYERGAVGMALSGKDTGGSQWFVTHSPQPHLDGGYTVFGRVIRGMDVVDNIARGDIIRRVIVNER